jgi:ATP-dependent DNA ligase
MSKRISSYVGPGIRVYDSSKLGYSHDDWIGEYKYDGIWCSIETDGSGVIGRLSTRTGQRIDVPGINGASIGLRDSIFIAELETTTDAAIECATKRGWTNTYWFDVIKLMGKDVVDLPQTARSDLVTKCTDICEDIRFIQRAKQCGENEDFESFYHSSFTNHNGFPVEGIVLKRKHARYRAMRSDGKTDDWVAVKRLRTADLIVIGTGLTPSGDTNLVMGIYQSGNIYPVQHMSTPKGYQAKSLVGKVVECIYDRKHMVKGRYRHLRFSRVRDDKTIEMANG